MAEQEKSNLVEITGLWINETQGGVKYFSGYMGNAKILIFKNKFKETEKHPDYKMYVAENKKKEEQASQPESTPEPEAGDDLPF